MAIGNLFDNLIVKRLADTPANIEALKAAASRDALPSVVARQDTDVLLLSGNMRTESPIARTQPDQAIKQGDTLTLGQKPAQVLYTDDGFNELDQKGLVAAVIEEGNVDATHPALQGRVLPQYTVSGEPLPGADAHATHVAGILAGAAPAEGLNGVAQGVSVLPINIRGRSDDEFIGNMAQGIRYAADHQAKVINISLGLQVGALSGVPAARLQEVERAIRYAERKDAVVVAAAGNHNDYMGGDTVSFPGRSPHAVSVGNYDEIAGDMRYTSSTGPEVDVAAPGSYIVSAVPGGEYKADSGTSMAAPYVAGAAALIKARHPDWTPAQIKRQLYATATDIGPRGRDGASGHGLINLFDAVFGAPRAGRQGTPRA